MDVDTPRTATELTPHWLTQVLRLDGCLDGSSTVTSYELSQIGGGFGQTSDTTRVSLAVDGPGAQRAPASVVVKFPTPDAARRRASIDAQLYLKEVTFYRSMASRIDTRVPHLFHGEIDASGEYFALVLEDFPGHHPGDETVGCTPDQARLAVAQMARLHAAFWGRADESGIAAPPPLPMNHIRPAWAVMVDTFGDHLAPEILGMREPFLDHLESLHDWTMGDPSTLTHGDFRLDNLLFGTPGTPDEVVVLDWQAMRIGRGMQDFAYLVGHSMNTGDRRSCEDELLDLYLGELAAAGIDYRRADARADYARASLYVFMIVLWITGVNVNAHERALRRKRALVQRAGAALLDADALSLLHRS